MGMEQPHYHHHHHHHYYHHHPHHYYHHYYYHYYHHHHYAHLLPGREVLCDLPGRDRVEGVAPQHAHLREGGGW